MAIIVRVIRRRVLPIPRERNTPYRMCAGLDTPVTTSSGDHVMIPADWCAPVYTGCSMRKGQVQVSSGYRTEL